MAEEYEFKEEKPTRRRGSVVKPVVEKAGAPVLNYRSAGSATPVPIDTDRFRNIQLPVWLLGGGILVEFVSSLWTRDGGTGEVLIELLAVVPLMLLGIAIAARLRGLSLRPWPVSLLKLAAIAVAPTAVVRLVEPGLLWIPIVGIFAPLLIQFILYFALIGALFELDESDTWYVVWILFLVRVAFFFITRAIFR